MGRKEGIKINKRLNKGSKILVVNCTVFLHGNVHKSTWTSPYGKTQNHVDHVLINRRWHSKAFKVLPLRGPV